VHPFASGIDTELPKAPSSVHLLLRDKASWVEPQIGEGYPKLSIEDWHKPSRTTGGSNGSIARGLGTENTSFAIVWPMRMARIEHAWSTGLPCQLAGDS
jgi:hypothetical protein